MWNSMIKPTLVLFLVCVIISGSLAYVNGITKDVIQENTKAEQEVFRRKVMEEAERFEKISPAESLPAIYEGYNGSKVAGYVVELVTKGYGGDISMTIGIGADGKVSGVIIGNNNETPGLGSKMAEPSFIDQFTETGVEDDLKLVKQGKKAPDEIQAISGATITSRGVTEGVREALSLVKAHMEGGK